MIASNPSPPVSVSSQLLRWRMLQLPAFVVVVILFANSSVAQQRLPIGFKHADRNSDGTLSRLEMIRYLSDRLQMDGAPYGKVFDELDQDNDSRLSEAEFDKRHPVIDKIIGPIGAPPDDPGGDYKPYQGPAIPVDDVKTFGAILARYAELIEDGEAWEASGWSTVELSRIPKSIELTDRLPKNDGTTRSSIDSVSKATVIIAGGRSPDRMFAAGAVLISADGLALTNFHVAEAFNNKLMALLGDGRVVRVTKFVAGDRQADIALIQLEGHDFPWVPIATSAPQVADDLFLVHHSENRYFTYDRGYVKRHVVARNTPWMEIEGDYGPGGSGCGIFNRNHELIGLVSLILAGDGAQIFSTELVPSDQPEESDTTESDESADTEDMDMEDMQMNEDPLIMGVEVIRVAVPWIAIDKITGTSK